MAKFTINQIGLPAGTLDRARTDGLITGAKVTLDASAGGGNTFRFDLLWVPPDDTTSVPSLVVTANPAIWEYFPTAGVPGEHRIQLTVDEGLRTEEVVIRTFAIRTPNLGLVIPAFNTKADKNASLILDGPSQTDASEDNAVDYLGNLGPLDYTGWWRAIYELTMAVENGGGGSGAIASVKGSGGITPTTPQIGVVTLDGAGLYARNGSNGAMLANVAMGGFAVTGASTGTFSGALTALNFNGVALTTVGVATKFLNQLGAYVDLPAPPAVLTDYYVNDVTGNDVNPGTIGLPVKTIGQAILLLKNATGGIVTQDVIIHIAAHGGTGYTLTGGNRFGSLVANLTFIGDSVTEVKPPTTLTLVTGRYELKVTGTPYVVNELKGLFAECVSSSTSANVGMRRLILRNTTDSIFVSKGPPTTAIIGDVWRVVRPSTKVFIESANTVSGPVNGHRFEAFNPAINFVNLEFASTTDYSTQWTNNIRMYGVIFNSTGSNSMPRFTDAFLTAGMNLFGGWILPELSSSQQDGYGVSLIGPGGNSRSPQFYSSRFHGHIVCANFFVYQASFVEIEGGYIEALNMNRSEATIGQQWGAAEPNKPYIFFENLASPTTDVIGISHYANINFMVTSIRQLSGTGRVYASSSTLYFYAAATFLNGARLEGSGANLWFLGNDGSTIAGGVTVGSILTQNKTTFAIGDAIDSGGSVARRYS
jgi:hypothetical protein